MVLLRTIGGYAGGFVAVALALVTVLGVHAGSLSAASATSTPERTVNAASSTIVGPRVPAPVPTARLSGLSTSSDWNHGHVLQFSSEAPPLAASPAVMKVSAAGPSSSPSTPTPVKLSAASTAITFDSQIGSQTNLGPLVPSSIRQWGTYILSAAQTYRLDPNLIAAVMMTESNGNPNATSSMGAVGLMQVIGGSYDPATNVHQGAKILATDLQTYHGDIELALSAYNAGAHAVNTYQGIPPYLETENYVFKVLNRYYLYSPSG